MESKLAVEVVGDLRRGPEGELVVRAEGRDRAVRFDRRVRVALEEEPVVADVVRRCKTALEIAKRKVDLFEHVGALRLVVDLDVLALEGFLDREDRLEVLVLDLDERERIERRVLIERRHGRDGLADVPNAIHRERGLVLSGRHDPHLLGHVGTGHDRDDPGICERALGIDPKDPGVRTRRPQKAPVQHSREEQVVGVPRLAGEMRPRVDLREASADDAELAHGSCAPVAFVPPAFRRGRGRGPWARSDAPAPPSLAAAFSIAS